LENTFLPSKLTDMSLVVGGGCRSHMTALLVRCISTACLISPLSLRTQTAVDLPILS